jgi:hypothetical protein
MIGFIRDLWALLNEYKLRAYDCNGKEQFAIPLSWIFVVLFFCLI